MKGLLLLIIGIALMDGSTKDNRSGNILSLPYTVAVGRWYKDQPPHIKTRRSKKPQRGNRVYIPA